MTAAESNVARGGIPVIWDGVPTRNKNFTGRDYILERLREGASSWVMAVLPTGGPHRADSDPGNPIPQGVHGLGGVGKTAIATEYAWRYQSDYDLVWWIAADQLPTVRGSLTRLAQRLGLEASPTAGNDGLIEALRDALRRGEPYRRWLLVFDNADQPEDIQELIPAGPGDVLITSRNHRWESVIRTVPMDVFRPEESRDFLLKRVPGGLTDADADRLAKELGHLPLALEQAGAMLAEGLMPADEYLRLLREQTADIMSRGKPPTGYPETMTAAWRLSVNAVERSRPEALEVLRCCAFFGPEPIPRSVFRPGVQKAETVVGKVLSSPTATASVISELARYALITLDGNAVKVHRLIQALVRDDLTLEQQGVYRKEAHLIMAAAAPDNPDDARTWPRLQALLPHVNAEATELPLSREFGVRGLARGVIRYLYGVGDYASALTLTERFIEQWTRDSGPDDENVLRAQRHLGNTLRLMGRYREAYRVTEEALGRARVTLGENDTTTLSLRTGFGADLRAVGDFAAALELDAESRTLLERAYGSDDIRTLRLLKSLALDYGLTGNYPRSQELFELAYAQMSDPNSGATASDVINAQVGISFAVRLQGRFNDALYMAQAARDYGLDESGLGAEHVSTLDAVNAYLIAARRLPEQRMDAREDSRTLLDLATRRHGETNPVTLAIAAARSNLLRTIDEPSRALELAEPTVDRFARVYGESHPYYYGCMTNLALLKRVTGDPAAAHELDQEAVEGLTAGLGPDHHYTLTAVINLASDLAELGRLEEARALGEDALERLTRVLGEGHAHTLGCAANLALDLIATGDAEDGEKLRQETLQRLRSGTYGEKSPDYVAAAARRRLDPDFDPPAI
jgi:tetratricopeptide (TPR) repeat protein